MNLIEKLKYARRVSVPLVAINTADPMATMTQVAKEINGEGTPIVCWDLVRGVWAVNECGKSVAAKCKQGGEDQTVNSMPAMLQLAADFPSKTIVFACNSDLHLVGDRLDKAALQGVWNLRDLYKQDRRMLILLSPSMRLPAALHDDVIVLDEELPDAEQLAAIVRTQDEAGCVCGKCKGTGVHQGLKCTGCVGTGRSKRKLLADDIVDRAVEAVIGLSAFAAEQAVAMSLRPVGIDLDHLWSVKKAMISQVAGLSVEGGKETFADIGGLKHVKEYITRLFEGPHPPALVVQLAEIEKAMAGAEGDLSGTSQDALGVLLEEMENNGWGGMIAYGAPGTGKSLLTKTMANTFGRLSIVFDINATKGGIVGQSEQQVRNAVKTIKAIGGRKVFFVATANRLSIKPELMRRFRGGVWFFDLPDDKERSAIWKLQRKQWEINPKDTQPDDFGWSGSDIRNVCELAYTMGISLSEALPFAASNTQASPETIRIARETADGRFMSASYPGYYQMPEKSKGGRALNIE